MQLSVEGLQIYVAETGSVDRPSVLLLHGWPESSAAFTRVMELLAGEFRVVAMDLPGIGQSTSPPPANDKRTLARYVRSVVQALGLQDVTLVGHDIGGQIVYAYLRAYPNDLCSAVIMNVAVPGVEPWSEVVRNPYIWHFGFHAVPKLPELVRGHEAEYFGYFYDAISARPGVVDSRTRQMYVEAYTRPEALRTGFEWYRAFRQDEQDNQRVRDQKVETPVLYVRGGAEQGLELERYVTGLRQSGLARVEGATVPDSGHFAPVEQPEAVAGLLREFTLARQQSAGKWSR